MIKDFILLCNENSGFISAILTVIAIYISVKMGRLPYQEKLSFYHYLDSDKTEEIIATVRVSNVGSCPVYIKKLFAKEGYFKTIGDCHDISGTALIDDRLLSPQQTRTFQIRLEGYKCTSEQKWGTLRFVLKSEKKIFSYRANWAMG